MPVECSPSVRRARIHWSRARVTENLPKSINLYESHPKIAYETVAGASNNIWGVLDPAAPHRLPHAALQDTPKPL
jgi:hypothetical protein